MTSGRFGIFCSSEDRKGKEEKKKRREKREMGGREGKERREKARGRKAKGVSVDVYIDDVYFYLLLLFYFAAFPLPPAGGIKGKDHGLRKE